MVKLSEKSRRVLRRIYQGLGAATVSILFQACYGMPMDSVGINGTVSSKDGVPIPDIKVTVENFSSVSTDKDGNFYINVDEQTSYKLQFKDVDGPVNGSYKTLEKTIGMNEADTPQIIQLEEDEG